MEKSKMPSDNTDIRRTWIRLWPKTNRGPVYKRIKHQVMANENKPMTMGLKLVKRG